MLTKLKCSETSKRLDFINETISPDMIYKVNSLFINIQGNSDDIALQLEKVHQLGIKINTIQPNSSRNLKREAIKFVTKVIRDKYESLMKDKRKLWWSKSCKIICNRELELECVMIINDLITFLNELKNSNPESD